MAISKEDNHDVAKHLGKALAKKVSKVTDDSKMRKHTFAGTGSKKWTDQEAKGISKLVRARGEKEMAEGRAAKIPAKNKSIGTYYSTLGPKTDNGFKPERKVKMNKTPHWGVQDFREARNQNSKY